MPDWIPITEIIIALVIAIVPALVAIGIWIGSVNKDRSGFREFMKDFKDQSSRQLQMMHENQLRIEKNQLLIEKNQQEIREIRKEIRENQQEIREIRKEIRENQQLIRDNQEKIQELKDSNSRIYYRLFSEIESKRSPIHLTDKGKNISEQLDAVAWVERVASMVHDQVKGKDAYQIQSFSFDYMSDKNQYTDEEHRLIRHVAFENGLYEDEVHRVLALELRDKLISTMSETES